MPADFFRPGFNDRKWTEIDVPSNWEMQGFRQTLFRNVTTPFPNYRPDFVNQYMPQRRMPAGMGSQAEPQHPLFSVAMPNVPMDVNPTGDLLEYAPDPPETT